MRDRYYYCTDCDSVIPEEDLKVYTLKEGDFWKQQLVCPNCKGNSLEEAEHCKMCGAPIRDYDEYCDECKREVYKIWEAAVEKVMDLRYERCDMSTDYMDCRDAFIEYLDDTGVL